MNRVIKFLGGVKSVMAHPILSAEYGIVRLKKGAKKALWNTMYFLGGESEIVDTNVINDIDKKEIKKEDKVKDDDSEPTIADYIETALKEYNVSDDESKKLFDVTKQIMMNSLEDEAIKFIRYNTPIVKNKDDFEYLLTGFELLVDKQKIKEAKSEVSDLDTNAKESLKLKNEDEEYEKADLLDLLTILLQQLDLTDEEQLGMYNNVQTIVDEHPEEENNLKNRFIKILKNMPEKSKDLFIHIQSVLCDARAKYMKKEEEKIINNEEKENNNVIYLPKLEEKVESFEEYNNKDDKEETVAPKVVETKKEEKIVETKKEEKIVEAKQEEKTASDIYEKREEIVSKLALLQKKLNKKQKKFDKVSEKIKGSSESLEYAIGYCTNVELLSKFSKHAASIKELKSYIDVLTKKLSYVEKAIDKKNKEIEEERIAEEYFREIEEQKRKQEEYEKEYLQMVKEQEDAEYVKYWENADINSMSELNRLTDSELKTYIKLEKKMGLR